MMLMTVALKNLLKKYGSQEDTEDPIAVCKFFLPGTRWTWYIISAEDGMFEREDGEMYQDMRLFGYVESGLGDDCDEFGYVMLSELENLTLAGMFKIERDRYFSPTPISVILKRQ